MKKQDFFEILKLMLSFGMFIISMIALIVHIIALVVN